MKMAGKLPAILYSVMTKPAQSLADMVTPS